MSNLVITAEVGALVRGQFIRELKEYCFLRGYDIAVDENWGFLESLYRIKIVCPDDDVPLVKTVVTDWLREVS